jgi:hypothetical protein
VLFVGVYGTGEHSCPVEPNPAGHACERECTAHAFKCCEWMLLECTARGETDAKLAQKLGQLQPFIKG